MMSVALLVGAWIETVVQFISQELVASRSLWVSRFRKIDNFIRNLYENNCNVLLITDVRQTGKTSPFYV